MNDEAKILAEKLYESKKAFYIRSFLVEGNDKPIVVVAIQLNEEIMEALSYTYKPILAAAIYPYGEPCSRCDGTGRNIMQTNNYLTCSHCNGLGLIPKEVN